MNSKKKVKHTPIFQKFPTPYWGVVHEHKAFRGSSDAAKQSFRPLIGEWFMNPVVYIPWYDWAENEVCGDCHGFFQKQTLKNQKVL